MATPRLGRHRLTGADGGPLRIDVRTGAREGERRPAVLICHGFKGFKDWGFFPRLAERIALGGFTAVSFNLSGSGVGDGESFDELDRWERQRPSKDLEDLGTVTDFAASALGSPWLGLVGHSRGGGLAVLHAAGEERVRALVTWAGIDDFLRFSQDEIRRWRRDGRIDVVNQRTGQVLPVGLGALEDIEANREGSLNVLAAAGRVRVPWLIVHGTGDPSVPAEAAQRLREASGSPDTRLLLVEGAGHTFGAAHPWGGSNPDLDRVLAATATFLSGALGR